jgi:hypothetical protein
VLACFDHVAIEVQSGEDPQKFAAFVNARVRDPVNPRASWRSGHLSRTRIPRNFVDLRLTFADFGAFRFFAFRDFFDAGMLCVCYRLMKALQNGKLNPSKLHHSLNSPACSCVSITLPASS